MTPAQVPELLPVFVDRAPANSIEIVLSRTTPNRAWEPASIGYSTGTPGTIRVRVFDASGRLVRSLPAEHSAPGRGALAWDGTSNDGAQVANGAYFAKVRLPDGTEATNKLLIAR